jgi:hypothetical protein
VKFFRNEIKKIDRQREWYLGHMNKLWNNVCEWLFLDTLSPFLIRYKFMHEYYGESFWIGQVASYFRQMKSWYTLRHCLFLIIILLVKPEMCTTFALKTLCKSSIIT